MRSGVVGSGLVWRGEVGSGLVRHGKVGFGSLPGGENPPGVEKRSR